MTAIPPMQAAFASANLLFQWLDCNVPPRASLEWKSRPMFVNTSVFFHDPKIKLDFGLGRLSVAVTEFSAILLSTLAR